MIEIYPGDVILYSANATSKSIISRAVVAGEILAGIGGKGLYSHAAVVATTPGYQYEAKFPFTGRFKIDTSRPYEVWRLGPLTEGERLGIVRWCQDHRGYPYDLPGLLTFGLLKLPGFFYCSRFACLAYASVGRHPGDLIMSPDSIPLYPGARMIGKFSPKGA